MKTVHFSKIVERCGKPENYLVLMDPAKDRGLQKAVKANRVMTIVQNVGSAKADYGEIGFEKGRSRQFLVFPKTLRPFAGKTVTGIKYDLLDSPEEPEKKASVAPPQKRAAPKLAARQKPRPQPQKSPKVVPFKPEGDEEEDGELAELKRQVRHAMAVLEAGKPVAAFNLLKRAVSD